MPACGHVPVTYRNMALRILVQWIDSEDYGTLHTFELNGRITSNIKALLCHCNHLRVPTSSQARFALLFQIPQSITSLLL